MLARRRTRYNLGVKGRAIPELGVRGGGWVAAQIILLAGIGASALVALEWPDGLRWVAYAAGGLLIALGLLLVVAGGIQLGSSLTPFPAPRVGSELSTAGLYRRARHPMYGGGMLVAAGWSLIFATVLGGALTVALVVLFELKARREEAWLVDHYPGYADYRRSTRRRFLPFVY
jgi:protein-S-isoprenylcysteine O-methyltransferase Ste14